MGLVVGTPTTRIDALEKALGNGKFAADIQLPGLLHGKLRLSDQAHARVLSIDTSEAERLPGWTFDQNGDITTPVCSYYKSDPSSPDGWKYISSQGVST